MQKASKSKCGSTSHHLLKEKTKNRVSDLQMMFSNLQSAKKECRTEDIATLEEQVHQMLQEWNSELSEASPASSLHSGSLGSLSNDLARWLKQHEEEDDAISPLSKLNPPEPDPHQENHDAMKFTTLQEGNSLGSFSELDSLLQHWDVEVSAVSTLANIPISKPEPHPEHFHTRDYAVVQEDFVSMEKTLEHIFQGFNGGINLGDLTTQSNYHQLDLHEDFSEGFMIGTYGIEQSGKDASPGIHPDICPPPSAFLGPKCALWDCSRPAQGSKVCGDYCSTCHNELATSEGLAVTPILRPGGIALKDDPLFSALTAKTLGKEVGIPECEGAAISKCPWNAPDLFDVSLLEGEKIREWLFFDKPRRAFECGNRKQRSLPDYKGRGWHESRKQIMKQFGGQRRSYYMDPQPSNCHEWHLYEYEINNHNACSLYRLELKLVDGKKTPKAKVSKASLADLQKKMGRLTADGPTVDGDSTKGRAEVDRKSDTENMSSTSQS